MDEEDIEEESPLLDFKNEYIQVIKKKSCIGKNIWVYKLSKIISTELFTLFPDGQLNYPLGEKYRFYNFQSKGKFLMSGILDTDEIKVIPGLSSGSSIKLEIERKLTDYCQKS
jgi:hypothetical protein